MNEDISTCFAMPVMIVVCVDYFCSGNGNTTVPCYASIE